MLTSSWDLGIECPFRPRLPLSVVKVVLEQFVGDYVSHDAEGALNSEAGELCWQTDDGDEHSQVQPARTASTV